MTSTPRHCSECGTPLPLDAPRGACPRRLLLRGFESLPPEEATDPCATVHLVFPDEMEGAPPLSLVLAYAPQTVMMRPRGSPSWRCQTFSSHVRSARRSKTTKWPSSAPALS